MPGEKEVRLPEEVDREHRAVGVQEETTHPSSSSGLVRGRTTDHGSEASPPRLRRRLPDTTGAVRSFPEENSTDSPHRTKQRLPEWSVVEAVEEPGTSSSNATTREKPDGVLESVSPAKKELRVSGIGDADGSDYMDTSSSGDY